nr:expressed protein [Hymenolepis microstoma]
MSALFLMWEGDLDCSRMYQSDPTARVNRRHRPILIQMKPQDNIITIGRHGSDEDLSYGLESCFVQDLISPLHATIRRTANGNFELEDHSTNGTYVNYRRINGRTILNDGDIVCFGHLDAGFINPGDQVPQYRYDQKYTVAIAPEDDEIFSVPL